MNVSAIKTHKITEKDDDLLRILDKYLVSDRHSGEQSDSRISSGGDAGQASMTEGILQDYSVVAVTSKIVAICEGRFVASDIDKDDLIAQEAQYYLPRSSNKFNVMLTVKNNMLVAGAGVDESNADGKYVLWPKDPQLSANMIREHLISRFNLKNIGVIITDSKTTPLRWGVTGISLAHSGFDALENYIGKDDLFGRKFEFEQLNIADSLAASAVLTMGEGAEQTPLAIIKDISFVKFQDRNPTKEELKNLKIDLADDIYSPLLTSVEWKKRK